MQAFDLNSKKIIFWKHFISLEADRERKHTTQHRSASGLPVWRFVLQCFVLCVWLSMAFLIFVKLKSTFATHLHFAFGVESCWRRPRFHANTRTNISKTENVMISQTCIQFAYSWRSTSACNFHLVEVKSEPNIWPCDACAINCSSGMIFSIYVGTTLLSHSAHDIIRVKLLRNVWIFAKVCPLRASASNFVESNIPEILNRQHKNRTMEYVYALGVNALFKYFSSNLSASKGIFIFEQQQKSR